MVDAPEDEQRPIDLSRAWYSTDFGLTLLTERRVGSRQGVVILFLAAVTAFVIAGEASAQKGLDDVNVQGGWAYAARGNDGAVEHMAATRAAEDAAWLLLRMQR